MSICRRQYDPFLADEKRRRERNVRLLAKLENIEKKAAFLQAKTDRIKSLKVIFKTQFQNPKKNIKDINEFSYPIGRKSKMYATLPDFDYYEYENPRYVIKNITLDEAIEEISKRYVLIPKNSNIGSNYARNHLNSENDNQCQKTEKSSVLLNDGSTSDSSSNTEEIDSPKNDIGNENTNETNNQNRDKLKNEEKKNDELKNESTDEKFKSISSTTALINNDKRLFEITMNVNKSDDVKLPQQNIENIENTSKDAYNIEKTEPDNDINAYSIQNNQGEETKYDEYPEKSYIQENQEAISNAEIIHEPENKLFEPNNLDLRQETDFTAKSKTYEQTYPDTEQKEYNENFSEQITKNVEGEETFNYTEDGTNQNYVESNQQYNEYNEQINTDIAQNPIENYQDSEYNQNTNQLIDNPEYNENASIYNPNVDGTVYDESANTNYNPQLDNTGYNEDPTIYNQNADGAVHDENLSTAYNDNATSEYNQNVESAGYNQNVENTEYDPNLENTGYAQNMENTGYDQNLENTGYAQNMENTGYDQNLENTGYAQNMENTGYDMQNTGYNDYANASYNENTVGYEQPIDNAGYAENTQAYDESSNNIEQNISNTEYDGNVNSEYDQTASNAEYNQNENTEYQSGYEQNDQVEYNQNYDDQGAKPLEIFDTDTEQTSIRDESNVQESDFDFSANQ